MTSARNAKILHAPRNYTASTNDVMWPVDGEIKTIFVPGDRTGGIGGLMCGPKSEAHACGAYRRKSDPQNLGWIRTGGHTADRTRSMRHERRRPDRNGKGAGK